MQDLRMKSPWPVFTTNKSYIRVENNIILDDCEKSDARDAEQDNTKRHFD